MKALGSPAGIALTALLLAAILHPASLDMRDAMNAPIVIVVSAGLLVLALMLRAFEAPRPAAALLALGAFVVMGGTAFDAVRGHEGSLRLAPGQAKQAFDERGPAGIALGARPLGAMVGLESLRGDEAVLEVQGKGGKRRESLAADRALRLGDFRLGWSRLIPHARLTVGVVRGGATETVEVSETEPGVAGDLQIEIDRYFPDFALDAANKPFSRSDEPRNPAALLRVYRGEEAWRLFVLRAMPGVHDVPNLDARLSLRAVENEPELEIAVHAAPSAPWLAAGLALAAAGLALGARR